MSRQFGLIIPGKQKKSVPQREQPSSKPSIFNESSNSSISDGDESAPKLRVSGRPGVISGPSLMERRVTRNLQEKALAEDPTIFQYDELYDDMDNKREEVKESNRLGPRKAKYIGRLMEHAERRKLENELRIERQVQKDREAEGEIYKDKDTYVTAAYRKKLESIRQLQEQEQRDEYLEAIGDVTKQKDLDGFYRHLFEQKVGTQQPVFKPKTADGTEEVGYKPIQSDMTAYNKHRTYRRRCTSEDDEQCIPVPSGKDEFKQDSSTTKAHLHNNIDADSDFSIDDSSEEEEHKPEPKTAPNTGKIAINLNALNNAPTAIDKQEKHIDNQPPPQKSSMQDIATEKPVIPNITKKPVDLSHIWLKRTTGEVFDAALSRYEERKLARHA